VAAPETLRRVGGRPGPKPRLSREKIIDRAIELGIEQIFIGSVATALDAAPASLCRHVTGIDDLVRSALEKIFSAAPMPALDEGWRAYLQAEAHTRFELLERYAGLPSENVVGLAGPAAGWFEELVNGLIPFGCSADEAVLAVDAWWMSFMTVPGRYRGSTPPSILGNCHLIRSPHSRSCSTASPPGTPPTDRTPPAPLAGEVSRFPCTCQGSGARRRCPDSTSPRLPAEATRNRGDQPALAY